MKIAVLVAFFLLTAVTITFAQDKKETPARNTEEIHYVIREAVCPDCQGWGWVLSKGYSFGRSASRNDANSSNVVKQSTVDLQLVKSTCYLCFGKGFVHVREPKK
jgi:hypothetical protein